MQGAAGGRLDVTHDQRLKGFWDGKKNCAEAVKVDPNDVVANMNVCNFHPKIIIEMFIFCNSIIVFHSNNNGGFVLY